MYHSISNNTESGVKPFYKVTTSPRRFEEQMKWLYEQGYQGVSLEDALTYLDSNPSKLRRLAAITFDDGFRDYYSNAWPVLRRYGFTATVHLVTNFVCQKRKRFQAKECLTWDEVHELRRDGTRFGSHTVHHPVLYEQSWEIIEKELVLSKARIEQELGEPIVTFAYPFAYPKADGRFIDHFEKLLRESGYYSNVTTVVGRASFRDNPFSFKRLPINNDDDNALLKAKVGGDYDWMFWPQAALKKISQLRKCRTIAT